MSGYTQDIIDQVVNQAKAESQKQHLEALRGDIAESCFKSCTTYGNLKEDCVKKCTALYISSWNTMSQAMIPEIKKASGI